MGYLIEILKKKIIAIAVSATATIQILQILILPNWLDFLTNIVILGLVALVGTLSKQRRP